MVETTDKGEPIELPPELLALRRQFVQRLVIRLGDIRGQYLSLSLTQWDPVGAASLHRAVHSLTGTAGTFGLPLLSDAARSLEHQLALLLHGIEAPPGAAWSTIGDAISSLQAMAGPQGSASDVLAKPQEQEQEQGQRKWVGERKREPTRTAQPLIQLVVSDAERADQIEPHLAAAGYRVQRFQDTNALRRAHAGLDPENFRLDRPAAVVLDTPDSDDAEVRDGLLYDLGLGGPSGIPVVQVLGNDDLPARLKAARVGVQRTLPRPLQAAWLLEALDTLTGRLAPQAWRVLLVDDDLLLLEAHAAVLRAAGMVVRTLSDPLQTLDAVRAFDPDVLLLDVYMPEASGPELAAALRARDAQLHLPILFLSAETDMTQQLLALNLGGDDFLIKPVRPDHLVAAVTARAQRAGQNKAVQLRLETTLYERERVHLALDHHAIVSISDASGRIAYVNDQFCQVSEYEREELIGESFQLLIPSDHSGQLQTTIWESIARGEVWNGEILGRTKSGRPRWSKSTVTPFLDAGGRVYQIVVMQTDISASKVAEAAQLRQFDMQRTISGSAARLMAAPASATTEAIEASLRDSGQQMGAERVDLFGFSEDRKTVSSRYTWCSAETLVMGEPVLHQAVDDTPWMREQLLNHGVAAVPDVMALPVEAALDRQKLQALRVGALLVVAVRVGGLLTGVLCYTASTARHHWSEHRVDLLQVLSDVIGSAIARERADKELRDSEARLAFLVSSSPVTIFTTDVTPPYATTYISPNVKQMVGLEPEAFLNDPNYWIKQVHRGDQSQVLTDLWELIRTDRHQHEFRMRTGEGTYRWIHGQMKQMRDAQGQPSEIIGYWLDITERKLVEQEVMAFNEVLEHRVEEQTRTILESERIARATLDAMSARVVILDARGDILATNRAWLDLRQPGVEGTTMGEGSNYLAFCERACDTGSVVGVPIAAGIREVIAGNEASFIYEYADHLPGEQRWFVCRVEPFASDGAVRVVVSHENVTQMKLIEHQQMRSQRLESLGELAGGVAHDLNNALAPILMGMEVLKEDYPDESSVLNLIQGSARRGADMVRQLLAFAKGAVGERVVLDVVRLVREVENLMKGSFPKNIQLAVSCDPLLPGVLGDSTQLHQVLLNLCVNARDALPQGGSLSLRADGVDVDAATARLAPGAGVGRYVRLQISDTGAGIAPDILDRIFDPFFTTKGLDKGTGLGLSTVVGIVKGHKGFVQVHSQLGVGSTFSIHLPAHEMGEVAAVELPQVVEFVGAGEQILFVDDEPAVRDMGQAVLSRLGFDPVMAIDGADGLVKATRHQLSLRAVITDMHMPFMDGLAFARSVRRSLPDLPIIVCSGRLDDALAAEFQSLGRTVRLDKPFSEGQLAEALRVALMAS